MTDSTKVIIEADSKGRINISAVNDQGVGDGHRLAGPKYVGDLVPGAKQAKLLAWKELDAQDIAALRQYCDIWDEIHGKGAAR